MLKQFMLVVGLVLAVAPARAETPEERQACMDDAFKFCDRLIPDQDRVFQCLVQNNRIISPLCRSALAAYIPPEPQTPKATKAKAKSKAGNTSKGPLNLNPTAR